MLLGPRAAAADPSNRQDAVEAASNHAVTPRYVLRGVAGVGLGQVGFGGRVGLEAFYLPSRHLGVGLQGAGVGQTHVLGDSSGGWLIGPLFAVRAPARHGEWEVSSSVGVAHISHEYTSACLLACTEPRAVTRSGFGFASTLGATFTERVGGIVPVGIAVRGDLLGQLSGGYPEPEFVITLNGILGVAFGGR